MASVTVHNTKGHFSPHVRHQLAEEDRIGGWNVVGVLVSEITAGLVMGIIVVIAICLMV